MLGLHTKNGWRAGLAIAVSGTLIGLGLGLGPAAADHETAQADASAIKAGSVNPDGVLNQVFDPVLDGGTCTATYPGAPDGAPPEQCGDNLELSGPNGPTAYSQDANANAAAESDASATVAPITLPGLDQDLSLPNIIDGITEANTSEVLNGLTGAVGQVYDALPQPVKDLLIQQVNAALQDVITQLQESAVDIEATIGAVEAQCSASPGHAEGNGTVAGIDILITLGGEGGETVSVEIPVGTDPNTPLLVSVPDLVDDILLGVAQSLQDDATLDAALAPLGDALDEVRQALVDNILSQLEEPLAQLADGLAPLLQGTVNKQEPVSPTDGEITVTALEVIILDGTPLEGQLELAKVHCGPNTGHDERPDLQIDKEGQIEDGDAKFTVTVHNPTDASIDDVFVQDFYGDDIDAADVNDVNVTQGTFNKETGRWTVGTLGAGQTAKLTFTVDVDDDDVNDGIENAVCVNKETEPDNIQENDGVEDDTDGCDKDDPRDDDDDDGDDGDGDDDGDDDEPRVVDSGINDGGNLGALAITGLLAASTLVGSAARQRLLLDR